MKLMTQSIVIVLESSLAVLLLIVAVTAGTHCGPRGMSFTLSYELWDSPCGGTSRDRTAEWIRLHRRTILLTSRKFDVDPRAIAGVIAYEALRNVELSNVFGLTRSAGPGKVHYKSQYFSEGDPASKQIEELGLVPHRSMLERKRILATPEGAILYIAAILHYEERAAAQHGEYIKHDPMILSTFYNSYTPTELNAVLEMDNVDHPRLVPNQMGRWIMSNLSYVSSALQ